MIDTRLADPTNQVGGGESAQQEHLADADKRRDDACGRLEVGRDHVDGRGEPGAVGVSRQRPHRLVAGGEVLDERVPDIARGTGDQDHGTPSKGARTVARPMPLVPPTTTTR